MRPIAGKADLQDDPATSSFLQPPDFISGGGGLCSTTADYLTFCRALLGGGALGGVGLIGPKTLELMTSNHLPGGLDLPGIVAIAVQRGDLQRRRFRPRLLRHHGPRARR